MLLITGCKLINPEGEIYGSIFIVTQDENKLKLWLVDVFVYEATDNNLKKIKQTKLMHEKRVDEYAKKKEDFENKHKEVEQRDKLKMEVDVTKALFYNAKMYDGRETLKKMLVDSEKKYNDFIQKHDSLLDEYEKLCIEQVSCKFIDYQMKEYISALGEPLSTTTTRAEGKFNFTLPIKKNYIISAYATRKAGGHDEKYFWLVKFSFDKKKKATLFLSNNNITTVENPTSLVLLKDWEAEQRKLTDGLDKALRKFQKKFGLKKNLN
jgi:hypothetical protein